MQYVCRRQTVIPKGTSAAEIETALRKSVAFRRSITTLEDELGALPQADLPLRHMFIDGVYAREMFIAAGTCLVGQIHKYDCINFLVKGKITVATLGGLETLDAPMMFVSKMGVKRAGYAHEDTVWTTIHANPSDMRDVDALEEYLGAYTFEEFELFLKDTALLKGEAS